jgi:hypothetical protein
VTGITRRPGTRKGQFTKKAADLQALKIKTGRK